METLLERYKWLASSKSRSYFIPGADKDDVVQEAMVGLYKAIRDFKVEKETSYRSFAELCVTRNLISAVKTATRLKNGPLNQATSLDKPIDNDDVTHTLSEILPYPTSADPPEHLLVQEVATDIRDRLRRGLSEFEAQALVAYLNGQSYQEILGGQPKCTTRGRLKMYQGSVATFRPENVPPMS
jgi:RNA polymerase sporulation-specific sigma factor